MTVANGQLLSAGKGAELIRSNTGRSCTRQNLEKLCKQGRLPRSTASAAPVRVRADLLVDEYLSNVAPHQAEARQPRAKRQRAMATAPVPAQLPPERPDDLPEYTISRARSEFEKANLLELDRKTKEGQLLRREDVEQAWASAVNITRTKVLGVPSRAKQQIPHLSPDEVELIRDLIREALDELAAGEVTA
jgi:hypothetical protein